MWLLLAHQHCPHLHSGDYCCLLLLLLLLLPLFAVVAVGAAATAAVVVAGGGACAGAVTAPTDRDTSKYVYCVVRYNIVPIHLYGIHVQSAIILLLLLLCSIHRAHALTLMHARTPNKRKAHEPNDRHEKHWQCSKHTQLSSIFHTFARLHVMLCQMSAKNLPSSFICRCLSRFNSDSITLDSHSRLVRDIPNSVASSSSFVRCVYVCAYKGASNFSPNLPFHFNGISFDFTSALCVPWSCNWFQKP